MCKVSVLLPVYNAEKYLAEAIDSIIVQTYTNWELIIINDGSTDSSDSIIKSYDDKRILYYTNGQNIGLVKTLNKGIALCSGKYTARMDADDVSHPQRLQEQVTYMESNFKVVMCGTNGLVIDNNGIKNCQIVNPSNNTTLQISLLFTNPFIHPSIIVKTDILQKEIFDEKWLHVEDFELWTRIALRGEISNISKPLLKYRWHETNVSIENSSTQEESKSRIIKKQLKELKIHPSDYELELHQYTFNLYSLGIKNIVESTKFTDIANWFKKLSTNNRIFNRYPKYDFDAYIWSRWIVLCITQKRKTKMFFPKFIPNNLITLYKTIKLVIYLSKK